MVYSSCGHALTKVDRYIIGGLGLIDNSMLEMEHNYPSKIIV